MQAKRCAEAASGRRSASLEERPAMQDLREETKG